MLSSIVRSEVVLPKILGSNMVLQRNKALPVWGRASAGEAVRVIFGNQTKTTFANDSGQWEVVLDPLKTSMEPAEMTISGTNTIVLKNILVGEVWLCSGQSNMEYSMNKSAKFADARRSKGLTEEELKNVRDSGLRLFLVKRSLYEGNGLNRGWEVMDFEAVKGFSAVGYFFAAKLRQELNVPVGIISSAIPGSPIERWAPEEAFASQVDFDPSLPRDPEVIDDLNAGKFFYSMIQPLAPFALKGFLWYQGETNAFKNEALEYTDKMQAMINTWRSIWRDKELSFYFVQITPFHYSESKGEYQLTKETLPKFWEAQAAALEIPHTGMVVTTDLNDSPDELHPTYKWEIGRRLGRLALARDYGKKSLVYSGPVFRSMKTRGNKAVLSFSHTGSGLISKDGKQLTNFEVAGTDGNFVAAEAVIKGKKVIVSAEGVESPQVVRFAWDEVAQPNLFNKEGLPAVPFRTNAPEWQKD